MAQRSLTERLMASPTAVNRMAALHEDLIRTEVEPLINRRIWDAAKEAEKQSKTDLRLTSENWSDVVERLRENE